MIRINPIVGIKKGLNKPEKISAGYFKIFSFMTGKYRKYQ